MKGQQLFDHQKIDINIAKLKTHGHNFEIVVDPDLAIDLKHGKKIDFVEILKAEKIFSDANKGLLASEEEMEAVFNTTDLIEVAKKILQDGDIQLTAEYRDKVREEKRKRILNIIHRNGIDPKTKLPHPMQRLENAFSEAKIKVDEFKRADEQVNDVLKKITSILPIRFAKKEIELVIPAVHASKLFGKIQRMAEIKKDEWMNDGSWFAVVEIPAGMQNEFFDELNKETKGDLTTKILGEK